jgi:hypothetical protein
VGRAIPHQARSRGRSARRAGFERDRYLVVDRSLTFGEYLGEWLASKAKLKQSTRASYVEHVELYFKPGLGHVKLVELRDRHFEELYAAMRQLGRPTRPARRCCAASPRCGGGLTTSR